MQKIAGMLMAIITCSQANSVVVEEEQPVSYSMDNLIQLTSDRRLSLPTGTLVVLTPTISLPIDTGFSYGYGSSATVSLPFKIDCDTLGMTSDENTWGRKRRDVAVPSIGNLAGGDRGIMYRIVERSLDSIGINGKACLLRAICEMFAEPPLENHGFVGEIIEVFLSPSRRHSKEERLSEYTKAEIEGKSTKICSRYYDDCPYSFFTSAPVLEWVVNERNFATWFTSTFIKLLKMVVVLHYSKTCAACTSVGHVFLSMANAARHLPNVTFSSIDILANILPWHLYFENLPSIMVHPHLRSNGWKLELRRFNTSQCGNFFTYEIPSYWNRLPAEVVESATVDQFKSRLDRVIDSLS